VAGSPLVQSLVLETDLEEVARAEDVVLEATEQYGYDGADRFAIKLALEEALANAIKHGNRMDPTKQVTVEFQVDPRQIRISVCDQGGGFDPGNVPDPTLDENLEKPHGRGVMLIRCYMSSVEYNQAGNCLTMIRHRGSKGPLAPGQSAMQNNG